MVIGYREIVGYWFDMVKKKKGKRGSNFEDDICNINRGIENFLWTCVYKSIYIYERYEIKFE